MSSASGEALRLVPHIQCAAYSKGVVSTLPQDSFGFLLLGLPLILLDATTKVGVNMMHNQPEAIQPTLIRPIQFGMGALVLLLVIYFGVVSLISGMSFAIEQFVKFWYFIVPLALGFGIQVGLYVYLKNLVGRHGISSKVVAVSGTTSTAAMVSCCAHYLTNILPILGVTGFLAVIAEYQVQLFWLGLAFNIAGVMYILSKVIKATREHEKC